MAGDGELEKDLALVSPAALDDDDDDEDLEETLAERFFGLAEMFPDGLRNATTKTASMSYNGVSWLYSASRTGLWVVASSAVILALPVMFETERSQMEEQQLAQQRKILLGPNAAVSGGMTPSGMMPQVVPPPPKS